mmetsp:Transcript_108523/g.346330  ORF Transcript_108523/g.346330 Transcript_108523/m.346330 type:complete len:362 (+) Transcript_108523:3650-4735(+)
MLLASGGPVRLEEARSAEVVRALHAPNDRVWHAAFSAFELHHWGLSELPEELVLQAIVEVVSEALHHGVDWLKGVRREVQVPSRVILDNRLPLRSQGVAQGKHAIPVCRGLLPDAEASSHVLHHLGSEQALLHVVGVASAAHEDAHGTQALDAEGRDPCVQDVRREHPVCNLAVGADLDEGFAAVVQARRHHHLAVDLELLLAGLGLLIHHLGGLLHAVGLLELRDGEGVHPLRDLAERKSLEGLLRKRSQPKGIEEVDVLNLLLGVDVPLREPAVEWVYRLAGARAHHLACIREPPSGRMVHHDIDEVDVRVVDGIFPSLKLEPQRSVDVPGMDFLELLLGSIVVVVEFAEDAWTVTYPH